MTEIFKKNNANKEYYINYLLKKIDDNRNFVKNQWENPKETSTRHFIIDDLLPFEDCLEIYNAYPKDGNGFYSLDSFREKKKTSVNLSEYDPILSAITYAFQDSKVVDLISEICNFEKIEPDPKLYAGGLSMMFKNDFLNPHIDNSHDGDRKKFRRLNLLYYVSPNWDVNNGGNLELWDDLRLTPKVLMAKTNRLIVMETNKHSWHSVSRVVVDRPRCCVSNYYFSEISPDNSKYFHVTSFTGRPDEKSKKIVGFFDNILRNSISKLLKFGRGSNRINSKKDD